MSYSPNELGVRWGVDCSRAACRAATRATPATVVVAVFRLCDRRRRRPSPPGVELPLLLTDRVEIDTSWSI